jgi:type II secretory pathway component PulF
MSAKNSLAQAYYDLAMMLDAGLPILRSLDVVIEGREGFFKRILSKVRESLAKGSTLAEALSEHRSVFPNIDRMLIAAAEASGSLPLSLKTLGHWHEFVHRITRRLMMGLIYPFLLLHIAGLVIGLPALVLGQIGAMGYLFGVLRILLWLYVPTAIVVACLYFKDKVPLLRRPLDFAVLRIPVLGRAVYHMSVCRYAKAFNMLYSGGVPMAESTARATLATGNYFVERLFAGAQDSVRQGGAAWEGLSERLPAEYRHLWQIGEETGELDQTTNKIAEIAADRADLMFTEFSRWLPRVVYFIIMAVLAVMILTLAGQVYGNLPVF